MIFGVPGSFSSLDCRNDTSNIVRTCYVCTVLAIHRGLGVEFDADR